MINKNNFWAVYLYILQFLDGLLTWWGVMFLGIGTEIEGNPLVKYVMDTLGVELGLTFVKLVAIILIYYLFSHWSKKGRWILCSIYTIVVGIWLYAFLIHNFFI